MCVERKRECIYIYIYIYIYIQRERERERLCVCVRMYVSVDRINDRESVWRDRDLRL